MLKLRLRLEVKLLLLFIAVAIIPLFINNFVWLSIMRNQEISRASTEVSNISEEAKNSIQSFFTAKIIGLVIHSQTNAVRTQNSQLASDELQDYLRQDQDIVDIILLNAAGKQIAHVTSTKIYLQNQLTDDSNTPEFKVTTFVGGEQYISPVQQDGQKRPYVKIAVPIITSQNITSLQHLTTSSFGTPRKKGEINGVLIATVHIQPLWNSLNALRIGQDGYVFIIDDKGMVLNHPLAAIKNKIKDIRTMEEASTFLNNFTTISSDNTTEIVHQAHNELGQAALTTHRHIDFTNWGVLAQVPMTDVLGSLNSIEIYAVILFFATLLFTIMLSLEVAHTILTPVRKFQDGSQNFGKGNLKYRIDIHSHDEIEELANSFNNMAANLHDAFTKLSIDRDLIQGEKEKINYVLANITDAVIALDSKYNIILFNKMAETLSGFNSEQVLNKPIDQVVKFYEDDNELTKEIYLAENTQTTNHESLSIKRKIKIVTTVGKSTFINLICIKTKNIPTEDLTYILTLHDLTEELRLEKIKMDFVSMAAHELRTPLTIIKGYLSIFKQENQSKFTQDQNMFLDRIEMGAKQLTFMVENFLNVSRIERGALTLSLQKVNWVSLVKQIITDLKSQADVKNISLLFVDPAEKEIQTNVDPIRVQEVVINLINNAINYTPDSGKITISIEKKDNEVITHISDTGNGIPEEAMKNLFTKFYRVAGDLTASTKGTGLGLFISKTIVEMHHGKIWVESTEGKGSTFSFSLPTAA